MPSRTTYALFFSLVSLAAMATAARAQSDAVFEGRAAAGSMTIEEYNNVPVGMLLTPEQIKKRNEDAAQKAGEAAPASTAGAAPETAPALQQPASADTAANAAPDASTPAPGAPQLLSYEEILKLYRQGDFGAAQKSLEPLLGSEHAGAQELMGIMYRMGQGVDKDPVKAFELLRSAADAGRPLAQHHLASMYFAGEGTAKDSSQALLWIGLAVIFYPDGPEKTQARADRDNIFLQATRMERDSAQLLKREWLSRRGESHLLDLQ